MDLKENNSNAIGILLLVAYRITRGLRGKVADSRRQIDEFKAPMAEVKARCHHVKRKANSVQLSSQ
jgi:hypothetical protein